MRFEIFRGESPGADERRAVCSWYADAREGVLYFGVSAFWQGLRDSGSPLGVLEGQGPQVIGRFDLERRAFLPALTLARGRAAGVWDVLAHENGRLYFSVFYGVSGFRDLESGAVQRFDQLGKGLNEWARGPDGTLFVTRYAAAENTGGALLWIDLDGNLLGQFSLGSEGSDERVLPKSVAWDPGRQLAWVTSDQLPAAAGASGHPTLVLDLAGAQVARIDDVEVQILAFAGDATGYFAVATGNGLELFVLPPGNPKADLAGARRILLDPLFDRRLDFAQGIEVGETGRVLVTTWSGRVFAVDPKSFAVETIAFPRLHAGGLYYAAATYRGTTCASYCAGVGVVCTADE